MKRVLMAVVAAGLGCGMMLGCEEKKSDSIVDKAKAGATDAANKAKDAAAGAADKAKEMGNAAADKAKDMGNVVADKLKGEVKNLMDTVKGKVETLTKGGDSLKPDQKGEFEKAMTGIKGTWTDLSSKWDGLSGKTGEGLTKGLGELKDQGMKLMDTVKTTAEKFGIKLN